MRASQTLTEHIKRKKIQKADNKQIDQMYHISFYSTVEKTKQKKHCYQVGGKWGEEKHLCLVGCTYMTSSRWSMRGRAHCLIPKMDSSSSIDYSGEQSSEGKISKRDYTGVNGTLEFPAHFKPVLSNPGLLGI